MRAGYLPTTREIASRPTSTRSIRRRRRTVVSRLAVDPQGAVADEVRALLVGWRAASASSFFGRRALRIYLNGCAHPACCRAGFRNVVCSNFVKRSNLLIARQLRRRDRRFLARYVELIAAPQVPVLVLEVASAAYADGGHVEKTASSMLRPISPTIPAMPHSASGRGFPVARRPPHGG
jgi:hypothetical protein